MSEIDVLLEGLAQTGPPAFRACGHAERAWRARYLLMVLALGGSPALAWANALAPDVDGSAQATIDLIAGVTDESILDALTAAGIRIEDLGPGA